MKIFVISLLLMLYVKGDVQISDDQCIEENGAVTLTCTVGSLQNSVDWYFKAEQKVSCSNLADLCVPVAGTEDNRYTFSSVIANGQFTFKIDPASKNTDVGDYQCKHGSESKTVALAGCADNNKEPVSDKGAIIGGSVAAVIVIIVVVVFCVWRCLATPGAPTNVKHNESVLTWKAPEAPSWWCTKKVTGYKIEFSTDGKKWDAIEIEGQEYREAKHAYYRVYAKNVNGSGCFAEATKTGKGQEGHVPQGSQLQQQNQQHRSDGGGQKGGEEINKNSQAGIRPQPPLPAIGDNRNLRGLSANLEDGDVFDKKRLTPIGQESHVEYEEKPKKKKKKKKAGLDDEEPYVKESADL